MQPPVISATPPLDDALRQLLMQRNKIAAIKLYRDHHAGASLLSAKEYVERLQAALPAGSVGKGGTCLLLLCLLLAFVASMAFWSFPGGPVASTRVSLPPVAHR